MACLRIVSVLPGPAALDLKLKRQTQECANENDEAQNDHVVEGRINNDRPYDVSRNKKFESQKNSPSHILAAKAISVHRAPCLLNRNRAVATVAPKTITATPAVSTAVPTRSMISRNLVMIAKPC